MKSSITFLVAAAMVGCGQNPTLPPVYLGHVATTSGPTRALGEQEVLGIRLAIKELTRAGQERRQVVVKHSEARGQVDAFESQAVRMVSVSQVVGLYGGNTPEEVLRLDRARVPVLTPLGVRPRGVSDLVFALGITPTAQGKALARFAIEDKSVKKLSILMDDLSEQSRSLVEAFQQEYQKAFAEKYPKEESPKPAVQTFGKDAKFLEMAKNHDWSRDQAILFAGTAEDYKEWRKRVPTTSGHLFFGGADGVLRDKAPGAPYVATAFVINKDLPKTTDFAHKFRAAFQEDPDVHAALAYEGIQILAEAIERAQLPVPERLLTELRQTTDFPGLTGPLTIGSDRHLRRPIFIGRMDGDAFISSRRFDP